tara:strand:- start:563 stop:1021 length:459 start_codon:yes stop_codon:yes gene_type:complete
MGPNVKGNPLYISVYLLVFSYFFGEFIIPKYDLLYFFNLFGLVGLIISTIFFFSAFNLFTSYKENPRPKTESKRLIKTGIFAYSRNPIYISFVLFHFSMFLTFENVVYFLTSLGLFFWINNFVIPVEEEYLKSKFGNEFNRYSLAVKRWLFF